VWAVVVHVKIEWLSNSQEKIIHMPVQERLTSQKPQVRQTFEFFHNKPSKFTTFIGAIMCVWLLSHTKAHA
jgi:hypothetical protein